MVSRKECNEYFPLIHNSELVIYLVRFALSLRTLRFSFTTAKRAMVSRKDAEKIHHSSF